jgi:MFS transporter, Spinster family, sphingosine-1-phosphate transporter
MLRPPMADRSPFPRSYLAFALGVICLANFLNYLDRQLVSALEQEIRGNFALSKAEFGALWSAFTLGYMVCAPLVGYAAVRWRRTAMFAICVLVWSLATIGTGLAGGKTALYLSRFLIGVGEAGCLVIGPTLIVDFVSERVRGRALSIFYLGLPLGGTAGYLLGGASATYLGGWHHAFFIGGVPGLLVAGLLLALRDPARAVPVEDHHGGAREYVGLLRNRTLMLIIFAQAFAVMILVPLLHFGIAFFEQERGMTKMQASTALGVIGLVGGVLGMLLAGVIGDRLARRTRGAYALLAGIAYALALPALLIGFTATDHTVIFVAMLFGATCLFMCMPAVNTQIANAVAPEKRAMAYALAVFILHFLGDMAAPPAFGAIADHYGGAEMAFVRFSSALVLAATCCFVAARTAARDHHGA